MMKQRKYKYVIPACWFYSKFVTSVSSDSSRVWAANPSAHLVGREKKVQRQYM
jgi:hypothetical protein